MNKLICIAGLPGSGKSIAADFFAGKGFQFLRFGQTVLDEVMKRKLEINETNERKVREELRKKYGMAAIALLNLDKIKKFLKKGNVVVDGLYSFDEYKVLKKEFVKNFITIAIYAPPIIRYKRLAKRKLTGKDKVARDRQYTPEEAKSRDYAEIEKINKGGPIAMADYTILNTKSRIYFKNQLNKVYEEVMGTD
jgi:dephospho-CoA kinase